MVGTVSITRVLQLALHACHLVQAVRIHLRCRAITLAPIPENRNHYDFGLCRLLNHWTCLARRVTLLAEDLDLGLRNLMLQILNGRLQQFPILFQQVTPTRELLAQAHKIPRCVVQLP